MGPLPTKPGHDRETAPAAVGEGIFYGVFVPQPAPEDVTVFVDKSEALKLVKKYKRARFKSFRTRQEAVDFALYGAEASSSWPMSPPEALSVGEKPSPFRGPKPQDMVRFRKAIENGDFEFVQRTVWENPRYLVSSGDTPSILQEGSRYNALHVAAKTGDATICAYILTTVSNTEFIRKLYGDFTGEIENIEERCRVLVDLYLNTPDKGNNDTPLHFATKFGAVRVVQVLVAYPQCNKEAKNKHQQTAKDIICSRMNNPDASLKEEIAGYLEEQFFVPVLRSDDDCVQPTVGQPFSPTSPPELRRDIVSPVYEVQAVAGPMPKPQAVAFRRRWKTPPRIPSSPGSPVCHPTLNDPDKGWEKVGRELAHEWKVSWKEYWPFLNTYTNFKTAEGLQLLEEYLNNRFKQANHDYTGSNSHTDTLAAQKITLNKSMQAESHQSDEICPLSPISELCVALKACMLNSEGKVLTSNQQSAPIPPPPPPRSVAPPSHHSLNGDVSHNVKTNNSQNQHQSVSYLFMDKYCQTFAKRISDSLQRNIDSGSEFFNKEVQQFCNVVSSCISNSRFATLDFSKLHSRLGYCVAQRIVQSEPYEIVAITGIIHQNISRKSDADYSSSEEEDVSLREFNRRRGGSFRRKKINRKLVEQATLCISQAILKALEELRSSTDPPLPDSTEQQCEEIWTKRESCECSWEQVKSERKHFELGISAHKKLIFSSDEFEDVKNKVSGNEVENLRDCCEPSSGEESDESDTGSGEFFTPPSSPNGILSAVNSEDDLDMESPDEGPDVYIYGNNPSKLDTAVLEAIKNEIIPHTKYPNICRWRHLVLLHSSQEMERWQSPYKTKQRDSDCSTPSWHRALYIPRFENLRKITAERNRNICEGGLKDDVLALNI